MLRNSWTKNVFVFVNKIVFICLTLCNHFKKCEMQSTSSIVEMYVFKAWIDSPSSCWIKLAWKIQPYTFFGVQCYSFNLKMDKLNLSIKYFKSVYGNDMSSVFITAQHLDSFKLETEKNCIISFFLESFSLYRLHLEPHIYFQIWVETTQFLFLC